MHAAESEAVSAFDEREASMGVSMRAPHEPGMGCCVRVVRAAAGPVID
jgi:hypothetical protein